MKEKRMVKKTTIGLISKKATLHKKTNFFCTLLCSCFARLQRETSRNLLIIRFVQEMSVRVLVHFFSLPLIFTLVGASISYFPTAATKFSCCSSNKKMSPLFFISRSRSLSPFFSLSFAGLPLFLFFSIFLLLYIPNLWT